MRIDAFGTTRMRRPGGARRMRAFSLSELMIVVAIIGVVLTVAVPSFTVMTKDIELKQAKSDIFAALSAARSRALRERRMIALHIFYDNGQVYQNNPYRWGRTWDAASATWSGDPITAIAPAHIPTNKMTMRLEVAKWGDPATNTVEFVWPNDHDPIILPDSIGICQPNTNPGNYVDVSSELGLPARTVKLPAFQDFYIVFAEDGKLASVLVDYNCYYDTTTPTNDPVVTAVYDNADALVNNTGTWSATGLCIYDTATFKAKPDIPSKNTYVNRADNQVMISSYTGMPMSMGVNQ